MHRGVFSDGEDANAYFLPLLRSKTVQAIDAVLLFFTFLFLLLTAVALAERLVVIDWSVLFGADVESFVEIVASSMSLVDSLGSSF